MSLDKPVCSKLMWKGWVVFSSLCCLPKELILDLFCFKNFPFSHPPPPPQIDFDSTSDILHVSGPVAAENKHVRVGPGLHFRFQKKTEFSINPRKISIFCQPLRTESEALTKWLDSRCLVFNSLYQNSILYHSI